MVKGVSRRVIVVRSPDPRFFEEAIFIVKEDLTAKEGINSQELLKEAQSVADSYIKSHVYKRKILSKFSAPILVAAGAGIGALLISLAGFIF